VIRVAHVGDFSYGLANELADLARARWPPSDWARVMLDRRRKTLVACAACHDRIHDARTAGSLTP